MRPFFVKHPLIGLVVLIVTLPISALLAFPWEAFFEDMVSVWGQLVEQHRLNSDPHRHRLPVLAEEDKDPDIAEEELPA